MFLGPVTVGFLIIVGIAFASGVLLVIEPSLRSSRTVRVVFTVATFFAVLEGIALMAAYVLLTSFFED